MATALLRKIILLIFTSIQFQEHSRSARQWACSGFPPGGGSPPSWGKDSWLLLCSLPPGCYYSLHKSSDRARTCDLHLLTSECSAFIIRAPLQLQWQERVPERCALERLDNLTLPPPVIDTSSCPVLRERPSLRNSNGFLDIISFILPTALWGRPETSILCQPCLPCFQRRELRPPKIHVSMSQWDS